MHGGGTETRRHSGMKARIFLSLCLALGPSLATIPALANDSTFGGAGSDLVPLEETRVQMQSEDIRIEFRRVQQRARWHVTARYVFRNLTREAVRAQVGFPEYRCQDEGQDCQNVPFEDLRTEVDGTPVVHRQGALNEQHAWQPHLGVVWLYDVRFPAGRDVNILHTYSLASGEDVDQNQSTTYVTRTGALWAGLIGHARFTFRLPHTAHTISVPEGIALRHVRLVDPDGPSPFVEVVCEQSNWSPQGDLWLSFNEGADYAVGRLGKQALARSGLRADELCPPRGERDEATPAQRQMCVNDRYAVAGFPFKRKNLRDYYYGDPHAFREEPTIWDPEQRWYVRGLRPFPGLSAWQSAEPKPEPSLAASAPAVPAKPTASSPEQGQVSPSEPASPVHSRPPPASPRSGGCACHLVERPAGAHPFLVFVPLFGLALRRLTRSP